MNMAYFQAEFFSDLQKKVDYWLAEHPKAKIVSSSHTHLSPAFCNDDITLVIFYEEV